MKFVLDAQLPPRLTKVIARVGHDARHVLALGLLNASDRDIWRAAKSTGSVVVTKDEDFAALRQTARSGPAVVWLRVGNVSNTRLAEILAAALPEIVDALERGERLIEVC